MAQSVVIPEKGSIEKRGAWFVALSETGETLCSTKSFFKTLSLGFGISGHDAERLTDKLLSDHFRRLQS